MRNLAPVFWHEGLFLRPHHLQQQDRCQSDRIGTHMEYVNRFHYGTAGMEIEPGALRNQTIEISRGAFVFPGGEVVLVPENAAVRPRTMEGHLPPAGQLLRVFLGLSRIRPNASNYAEDGRAGNPLARYRVQTREVRDESTGETPATIEFGVANVQVLFGDEDRGAFECLEVAQVLQTGADHFEFSTKFIPPCLRIDSHPEMARICGRIRDSLLGKARSLQERKRDRSDPALQVQLLAVNSYVGLIAHQIATGNVHPFVFHGVLAQAAGALASFSPDAGVADLPGYAHDAPGDSFREMARRIEEYLEYVGEGTRFSEVPLPWTDAERAYMARMSKEHFADGCSYFLVLDGEHETARIRSQVESGGARIGAPDRISTLQRLHVRGVHVEPCPSAPADLPRRAGGAYYQVRSMGPEWDHIRESEQIAVHLPEMGDLRVSLFVVRT